MTSVHIAVGWYLSPPWREGVVGNILAWQRRLWKILFMTCQQHNWWIINSCPRSYPNFKIERSYENVDFRTWKIERRQTRLVSHFDYRFSSYSFFNGLMYCDLWISQVMLLACHKKSYLRCDEITKFLNIHETYSFFLKYKTETAKIAETAVWKWTNIT